MSRANGTDTLKQRMHRNLRNLHTASECDRDMLRILSLLYFNSEGLAVNVDYPAYVTEKGHLALLVRSLLV